MKIKILQSCSGLDFSFCQGEVVEVSAETGKDLIAGELAIEIKSTSTKQKAGGKENADT